MYYCRWESGQFLYIKLNFQVVECLVGLLDNPNSKVKLLALSTLSAIVAHDSARHSRENLVADLLVDCGLIQKLQLLLKHHSDADTVTAAVGCLKEVVMEDNKVIGLLMNYDIFANLCRILLLTESEGETVSCFMNIYLKSVTKFIDKKFYIE